jgi:hypothetical protein
MPSLEKSPIVRPRGWRRWLLAGGILLALFLARAPLLRGLAGLLIAEEPGPIGEALVLMGGNLDWQRVAEQIRASKGVQVLVIGRAPYRLEEFGVLPSYAEWEQRALASCGAPVSAIHILPGQTRDDWDRARVLHDWLRAYPDAHVAILCPRFGSRRLKIILERTLGLDAGRAHVMALADRGYDETNWWHGKDGTVNCWNAFVRLTYTWLAGEGDPPGPAWDLDAYERALR